MIVGRRGFYAAPLAALCVLSACASLHATQHPTEPVGPPASDALPPPEPAQPGDAESSDANAAAKTADATASPPSCSCVEAKPRPKPKPKPRPVHKEAPPQLPTAPLVIETPKGALVNAQVRPMAVSVMSILGKRVQGPHAEDLGRVVDVLADDSGRVRIAIIDFGGFLGVGARRIAVDWPLLRFNPDAKDPSLLLSISKEKLQSAPEYKADPRPQTLMETPVTPPPAAAPTPAAAASSTAPAAAPPAPAAPPPAPDNKK